MRRASTSARLVRPGAADTWITGIRAEAIIIPAALTGITAIVTPTATAVTTTMATVATTATLLPITTARHFTDGRTTPGQRQWPTRGDGAEHRGTEPMATTSIPTRILPAQLCGLPTRA